MKHALLALLLLPALPTRADVVVTSGRRYFGRIVAITPTSVVFSGACDPARRGEIDRAEVKYIMFDPNICEEANVPLPSAGMQGPCEMAPIRAFEVGFVSGGSVVAHDLIIANGKVHADLGQVGSIHGPASEIRFVTSRTVCPSSLADQEPTVPASLCLEPWHVAVNFSYSPVFNNQVFARGFTVYVESDDDPTAEVASARRDVVSKAFGSAIVVWTSALQQARKILTGDLAVWVDSIILRGGKYTLLSPPQAVPATCSGFGSIHVRWLTRKNTVFPRKKDYIAKAQVEGRTIVLDARDFDFVWNLRSEAIPRQQTDLIKVLAHEFGHCIGLQHTAAGVRSMMANVITDMPDLPTDTDAKALIEILGHQIRATAAGEFDATFCSGLRAGRPDVSRSTSASPNAAWH